MPVLIVNIFSFQKARIGFLVILCGFLVHGKLRADVNGELREMKSYQKVGFQRNVCDVFDYFVESSLLQFL